MLKKVRIRMVADQTDAAGGDKEKTEHLEMLFEGRCRDDGERFSITYQESELTGMEGATTSVSFLRAEPGVVTMLRSGSCRTALIFEEGRRHICMYETPVMTFEVCVHSRRVVNTLHEDGNLTLEYAIELRGAETEQTALHISLLPAYDRPQSGRR